MYKFAERSISVKTLPCVLTWSTLQPSASRPAPCGLPPKWPRAAPAAGGGSGARTPQLASRLLPRAQRSAARAWPDASSQQIPLNVL